MEPTSCVAKFEPAPARFSSFGNPCFSGVYIIETEASDRRELLFEFWQPLFLALILIQLK
jgi:hypothetical protein